MKKIIAVKGKSNTGKTTSIKKIHEWIRKNYAVKIIIPNTWTGDDIKTIIEVDGFKLGICSAGDLGLSVKSYMDEFDKNHCDLIICACRTKGQTFKVIQGYWSKGYLINYVYTKEISDTTFSEIKRRILGLSNESNKIRIFSYGSNMLLNRIRKRVKSAEIYQVGYINGYSLKFHKLSKKDGSGKANIYQTNNQSDIVWGVIISIDKSDKKILDRYEGLGYGYDEKNISVKLKNGSEILAIAYVANNGSIDNTLKPFDWYYYYVLAGAKENNLPAEYIEMIMNLDYSIDKDASRINENKEILEKTRR